LTLVLIPAQTTSVAGTMIPSLDPVLLSSTRDVLETEIGSRTLRLAWASVKDLQPPALELPPSLLPREDQAPQSRLWVICSAKTTMTTAIHRMRNRTQQQTALLPRLDATGLVANMGLSDTMTTAPVVKSATAQSHVMALSVPQEPPVRWSRIRLEGRQFTKQFVRTTPRQEFVLK